MIYGEPGGILVSYGLDLDRGEYVVVNEDGCELSAHQWETDAQRACQDIIEREERNCLS